MNKCIKCGSYAFNLYKDGIDQGGFCDVHYWQGRAHRAEASEQPVIAWAVMKDGECLSVRRFEPVASGEAEGVEFVPLVRFAEQPAQQEPVVWMYVNKSTHETKFQKHMRDFIDHSLWSEVPLYGEPLANHELQCICGAIWLGDEMVHLPDKRLPPQRTWVGLTDVEIASACKKHGGAEWWWRDIEEYGRAIEAKLKEKNT